MTAVTWDPAACNANITLSNGLLTASTAVTGVKSVRATLGRSSGLYYFEVRLDAAGSGGAVVGIVPSTASVSYNPGQTSNGFGFSTTGSSWADGTDTYRSAPYSTGAVVGVAVDFNNKRLWFAINNVWVSSGNPSTGANPAYSNWNPVSLLPAVSPYGSGSQLTGRFKSSSFSYTPPTGFLPWEDETQAPITLTGNVTLEDVVASGTLSQATSISLIGAVVLDDVIASGTLSQTVPITLTGNVTLEDVVASGTLTQQQQQQASAVTWDPNACASGISLSTSLLTATASVQASEHVRATLGVTTGRHYFELVVDSFGNNPSGGGPFVGLVAAVSDLQTIPGYTAPQGVTLQTGLHGYVFADGQGASVTVEGGVNRPGMVIGVALDADNHQVWFAVDNVWLLNGDPGLGSNPTVAQLESYTWYPTTCPYYVGAAVTGHFSLAQFSYPPPTGFLPWDGAVTPEPATIFADIHALLPSLEVKVIGVTGVISRINVFLPSLEAKVTGLTGAISRIDAFLPSLAVEAYGGATIHAFLPSFDVAAEGTTQRQATIHAFLPSLEADITGTTGSVASIQAFLSPLVVEAFGGATIEAYLPGLVVEAISYGIVEETTYVVNCSTQAVTQAMLGVSTLTDKLLLAHGVLYQMREDALYRLNGSATHENGQPVEATIEFAQQHFGTTRSKRLVEAYWSVRSRFGLSMGVQADEQALFWYQRPSGPTALECLTVKVGKGIRFHMLGIVLKNRDGEAFSIGGVELRIQPLRAARGG